MIQLPKGKISKFGSFGCNLILLWLPTFFIEIQLIHVMWNVELFGKLRIFNMRFGVICIK